MHTIPQHWIPSAAEGLSGERAFIRSVYWWMFGGLLLTALAAAWVVFSPAMQSLIFRTPGLVIGLFVAELVMVLVLSFNVERLAPATAAGLFLVYSLLNGFTLSGIALVYATMEIFQAFAVAAGMFGAMSLYGLVTKKDLTSWGSFLFMGLVGVLMASIVSVFARHPGFTFAVTLVGVFVFLGLTAWDTQKLKAFAAMIGEDNAPNYAVVGALSLYLDFINIFLMVLRLLGRRERR